jgi:hypothetical protein
MRVKKAATQEEDDALNPFVMGSWPLSVHRSERASEDSGLPGCQGEGEIGTWWPEFFLKGGFYYIQASYIKLNATLSWKHSDSYTT